MTREFFIGLNLKNYSLKITTNFYSAFRFNLKIDCIESLSS